MDPLSKFKSFALTPQSPELFKDALEFVTSDNSDFLLKDFVNFMEDLLLTKKMKADIHKEYFDILRQKHLLSDDFYLRYLKTFYSQALKREIYDISTDSSFEIELLRDLAGSGNLEAIYTFAMLYRNKRDFVAEKVILKHLIECGYSKADLKYESDGLDQIKQSLDEDSSSESRSVFEYIGLNK